MEQKQLNIVIPLLSFGREGGYKALSALANALVDLGHHVTFLSPSCSDDPYHPTKASILWVSRGGMPVENNVPRRRDFFYRLFSLFNALKKLQKVDVLIANQAFTSYPVHFAGRSKCKIYYVQAYEPEFYYGSLKYLVMGFFSRLTYRLPLEKIVNASLYQNYRDIQATRVVLPIVNGQHYYPKIRESDRAKITIGTIGRAERHKGTQYVVDAIKVLREEDPRFCLHIAFGDPAVADEENGIIVSNPHGDANLAEYYRSLDVYVCCCTIQYGSVHYPVVEAMACGIPVVTTQYYPANQENAWLLPDVSTDAVMRAIKSAVFNKMQASEKAKCALKSVEEFDSKNVGAQMNRHLKELCV